MILKIKTYYKYAFTQLAIVLGIVLYSSKAFAGSCQGGDAQACLCAGKASKIMDLLVVGINVLSAFVGVAAVVMLVIAGIQYSASNGNPKAVADSKQRIYNVFIGLAAFMFLWAFLQWLIPGGVWHPCP